MPTTALPEPRPVLWPFRERKTARVSYSPGTPYHVRIHHAPLAGVTAEMLAWWYGHVPGTMEYAGEIYPRYLVWHPLDHISYEANGGPTVTTGSRLRIREALHRNPDQLIDIRVEVEELTAQRAVITKRALATTMVRLENDFADSNAGATYRTTLTVGSRKFLGRLALNRLARRRAFPPDRVEAWITHHIEEIGNLENFLPDLYATQAGREP
jgi:hypothetical protein